MYQKGLLGSIFSESIANAGEGNSGSHSKKHDINFIRCRVYKLSTDRNLSQFPEDLFTKSSFFIIID